MTAGVVTIPGVELVAAGDWHGTVNGVAKMTRVTAAELADMAAAALDPEVDHAPIKIGHFGAWADLGDSAPSLGWVRNHRVEMRAPLGPDGKPAGAPRPTLVGDLTDVPAGLADVMPKAFRRRSAEFVTAKPGQPITTPAGRSYSAVLTGLALLGMQPPAVKGLNDVLASSSSSPRAARPTASSSHWAPPSPRSPPPSPTVPPPSSRPTPSSTPSTPPPASPTPASAYPPPTRVMMTRVTNAPAREDR
jgi:hypothetical protein